MSSSVDSLGSAWVQGMGQGKVEGSRDFIIQNKTAASVALVLVLSETLQVKNDSKKKI